MIITDSYSTLKTTRSGKQAHPVFQAWGYTEQELRNWFNKQVTPKMEKTAELYLKEVQSIVAKVEESFGSSAKGEWVLIPSMGEIDGFARFDQGTHTVMIGVDFPDASLDYLKALTAHELSHVYRDHSPEVWGFLGKPLHQVSRAEYLEAMTGQEHLVSEGLATLTSQAVFPEISIHDHHYYDEEEMNWCFDHTEQIDQALRQCLRSPLPDPWQFYAAGTISRDAPSRIHYFWAAQKIDQWIKATPGMTLTKAHSLHASQIQAI